MKNYNIKKSSIIKELNLSNLVYETYGGKPQEIIVSEEQLNKLVETQYNEQLTPPVNTNVGDSEDLYTDMTVTNEEDIFDDYRHERPSYEKGRFTPGDAEDQSDEGFKEDEIGAYLNMDKLRDYEINEDSEGEETYNYDEDLYHDKGELEDLKRHHDDLHHIDDLKKDMDYDEDRGVGKDDKWRKEAGTDFRESVGDLYVRTKIKQLDIMIEETFGAVRKSIIRERISKLNRKNYTLTEQSEWRGHNPGVSAAAGIDNIIDNLKKAWTFVKDDKTRKQIMNTLTKLNNFMTYTAELIGSGEKQSKARGYDQVADPIPYPDLDEPEGLEDVDDEIIVDEQQIIKPISKSVLKEANSCKGLDSDCDMNFVNKHLFHSNDGYKRTPLTMVQWGAYDDRQRKILMGKAEKVSKGSSIADV